MGIAGAIILDTEGNRGLYHNSNLWCWTAPPANPIYRIVFYYALVWAAMAIATFSMAVIYYRVLVTERHMAKDASNGDSTTSVRRSKNKKASNKIASQAIFYIISFYHRGRAFRRWSKDMLSFQYCFYLQYSSRCKASSTRWSISDLAFCPIWRQIQANPCGILLPVFELLYQRKKWQNMCRKRSRVVEFFPLILTLPKQQKVV